MLKFLLLWIFLKTFFGGERGKPPTNHPHCAVQLSVHYIDNWSLCSTGKTNFQVCSLTIPVFSCSSSPAPIKIQVFPTSFLFLTSISFSHHALVLLDLLCSWTTSFFLMSSLRCGFGSTCSSFTTVLMNHPLLLLASGRINVFFQKACIL